ncbi:prickle-like protein 4 isoform X3 [Octodon degus]|uniref:Prickle-like protein 4 isoform X3 n=1 Tax=Octodon degus TaxID=10160 RepID=A0A6P6ETZ7_OCTDE|nr:prickle-like protein 4 isoform X3 [Octodon degus]
MLEEVAALDPEGEQSFLATFHRKPDLGTGRKQDPAAPSMYPPCQDTSRSPNWPGVWTLLQQLPPQDSDCRQQLKPGEAGVFAVPEGKQRCWHQACFACQACSQVLTHLIYFYHDGHLYCGRHHAELLRSRCPACDQLIFSQGYTEAEGRHWHENHFCCQDCAVPLAGGCYALPGGSPCCLSCFESRYPDRGLGSQQAPEGPGVSGPDRSGGSAVAQIARCSPVTPRGRGRPDASQDPEECASCPTCSSSSDSEPEGFFLGQRLPRPRKIPEDSDASGKRCSVC